ncbi:hypothetical protein BGP_3532 [Beggiatoa sp. PS]|nr:hypothetical protein BGP_3532 [Beggiatoa sp. PS]
MPCPKKRKSAKTDYTARGHKLNFFRMSFCRVQLKVMFCGFTTITFNYTRFCRVGKVFFLPTNLMRKVKFMPVLSMATLYSVFEQQIVFLKKRLFVGISIYKIQSLLLHEPLIINYLK